MDELNEVAMSPVRLLLVDDEEGYVNVLANRLAKRGIAVEKAMSGTEAIQAISQQDVAILDLRWKIWTESRCSRSSSRWMSGWK